MDQELRDLKSVLRSLVVSSPTQVDMRSLLRDYRSMMGEPIPIARYGYRDTMLFLKERCGDCFVLQGPASNPILTLIVPETLKHIDQFVQKQKLSSTVKYKGKRRSIPGELLKRQDSMIVSTLRPTAVRNSTRQQEPVTNNLKLLNESTMEPRLMVKSSSLRVQTWNKSTNLEPRKAENNALPISKSIANIGISDKENKQSNSIIKSNIVEEECCSSEALQKFLKKRLPVYKSSSSIDNDNEMACNGERTSSKDDADSGRLTLSSSSSTKAIKLEALKTEILGLIADHPEGVWCTDLMRLYRERYGRELDFSRFGYTSILSLVLVMEEALRATAAPDTGNWLLTDARAPPPPPRPRARAAPRPRPAMAPVDPDDALPGIDFDPEVFPDDCMHFMESIPGSRLEGLGAGVLLDVLVGEVYSPSHFWLLRLGPDHYDAMNDMMDDMTKYYTYGEGKDRVLALGAVRVGHYCSTVYERDWHRSLIVRIIDSDTVKVRHVDYGTVETVNVSALKPLLRVWAVLPAQAVRARLGGVCPPARGRRWPHAASAHFLHLVADQRLVANVLATDTEEDILEVFLINTQTEDDVYIDKEMVRSGHADPRTDRALQTSPVLYLFPRFDALENGATPNFSDIHGYLRDGIALEFVDEYRRHVPSCLPPLPPPAAPAPDPDPAPARSLPLVRPSSPSPSSSIDGEDSLSPGSLCSADRIRASAPEFVPTSVPAPDPPPAPSPARSAPAPALVVPETFNRIPLMHPPLSTPPPQYFRPPRPPPHSFSPMMPMHPYGGFPPFPGPMPFYPPMCPSPSPAYMPGPPGLVGLNGPHRFHVPHRQPVPRSPGIYPRPNPIPNAPRNDPLPNPSDPSAGAPRPPPTDAPPPSPPAGGVTLSVSECEIFKLLSSVNPEVAQRYVSDTISRAIREASAGGTSTGVTSTSGTSTGVTSPSVTLTGVTSSSVTSTSGTSTGVTSSDVRTVQASSLNPEAAEFRLVAAGTQTEPVMMPFKYTPLPPGMRPPPGFGG